MNFHTLPRPDSSAIPPRAPDMPDKTIVFRSLAAKSPMPSDTDEERRLYAATVEAELLHLLAGHP